MIFIEAQMLPIAPVSAWIISAAAGAAIFSAQIGFLVADDMGRCSSARLRRLEN